MGKIYILGEGKFRGITSKDKLKELGYISGKKVSRYVFKYVCYNTYAQGGSKLYKDTLKLISETLDFVKCGTSKATTFYYLESEVITLIGSIVNNDNL